MIQLPNSELWSPVAASTRALFTGHQNAVAHQTTYDNQVTEPRKDARRGNADWTHLCAWSVCKTVQYRAVAELSTV